MRRTFTACLLVSIALPAWPAAQFETGESLVAALRSADGARRNYARGYVLAVADVGATSTLHNRMFCIPKETTGEKVTSAARSWLNEHTKDLKKPAEDILAQALEASFPCPGK